MRVESEGFTSDHNVRLGDVGRLLGTNKPFIVKKQELKPKTISQILNGIESHINTHTHMCTRNIFLCVSPSVSNTSDY